MFFLVGWLIRWFATITNEIISIIEPRKKTDLFEIEILIEKLKYLENIELTPQNKTCAHNF
ncbi:hypothetical protein DERF_016017 [Dermatophagoides farinae]|uniref:Uncharacterized protein n=1 Tax=Dermatophagoides farinae TaxID=6954 RepID=A0A922KW17_DERFA|nr:hypothetical protein DERF_016017 [Dermatophagoides farinae]